MKKHFLSIAFLLLATITQAQPWSDTTISIGWYNYNYNPGGQKVYTAVDPGTDIIAMEDSLKVTLLLDQAKAILEQNTAEFVLLNVLCSHIAEPDFYEYRLMEVFPSTLDLHIERKSPYAIAAGNLKRRYFPEKD